LFVSIQKRFKTSVHRCIARDNRSDRRLLMTEWRQDDGVNKFARSVDILKSDPGYEQVVASRFSNLWQS